MRARIFTKHLQNRHKRPLSSLFTVISRSFSQLHSHSERPSFGIAFDIDGVILLGNTPIGGSPQALKRLYEDSGTLKIPYVFLTNGGGIPESKRACELSRLLGLNIIDSQVIQGHSPFKKLAKKFENGLTVAVGKGEPAAVMTEYGFKALLSTSWQQQEMFTLKESKQHSLLVILLTGAVTFRFFVTFCVPEAFLEGKLGTNHLCILQMMTLTTRRLFLLNALVWEPSELL